MWQKPRAELLEPLMIWKRDSDSCTCSCFQNPVWGWMLCSSPFLPWLWVVGSLSSPWCLPCLPGPRRTLDSCHIAGKRPVSVGITRQEEIGRSDRKVREGRGTRSSFFFSHLLPFLSSRALPHTMWIQGAARGAQSSFLAQGCHRKVNPDEIRCGPLLGLADSSKRYLM